MDSLQPWLDRYQMALDPPVVEKLEQYCQLVWAKNKQVNLTRHTTFQQFAARDLIDSLELSKQLRAKDLILDVGSGGGVPGLVLAVLRPDLSISLTDSVKKKARALEEMAGALGVHVEVYDCRAESLLEDFRYDATIARAVGSLAKLAAWFKGHWFAMGRILVIKGPRWPEELAVARAERVWPEHLVELNVAAEYAIPDQTWRSFILEIRQRKAA